MCKNFLINVQNIIEENYELLDLLESVITMTKFYCLEKDCKSNYYDFKESEVKSLSRERNDYINMLEIASKNIEAIKNNYENLEKILNFYNKIPTIAADK